MSLLSFLKSCFLKFVDKVKIIAQDSIIALFAPQLIVMEFSNQGAG